MIRCVRCAEENPDSATFCIVCGVKLGAAATTDVPATPAVRVYPYAQASADVALQTTERTAMFALITGTLASALMLIGLILILVGIGVNSSTVGSFGILACLLGVVIGSLAFIIGLVAFFRKPTLPGHPSRRHAIVAIVLGFSSMLLCCASGYLVTLLPSTS